MVYAFGVAKKSNEPKPEDLSFEQALESLEALIERVESGEIGLEEAITQYERGAALVKRCRSVLDVPATNRSNTITS